MKEAIKTILLCIVCMTPGWICIGAFGTSAITLMPTFFGGAIYSAMIYDKV